jgi:hypothetical protein
MTCCETESLFLVIISHYIFLVLHRPAEPKLRVTTFPPKPPFLSGWCSFYQQMLVKGHADHTDAIHIAEGHHWYSPLTLHLMDSGS